MERKRGLRFYVKIYFKIIAQDIKSRMSYRADFILSTLGMIATNIAGFVAFWLMFTKFPSINGWGYYEMLFLYGFSLVAITPTQCLLDNNWQLRQNVYTGDFIKYCFRPINLFFYFESEVFDLKGLGQLFFGIGTIWYSWSKLSIPFTFFALVKLIVFLITASFIMAAMQTAAAATCFWIMNSFYILDLSLKLKDYAKYPITIYNGLFKFIFTFIFPVAFIAYYPSQVILKPDNVPLLSWLSPLIGIGLFYLSYKFWMKGASKYDGSGS
ncbi:MAG: ABC-2 family transporter protein [Lachnospiraceae bacterium]|nr:ABC-2 family transporter protein [Lachnospiraceae bacterium]